ncbi:hypothetical protein T05_12939 [Trichinella murrelli]|uniref:Uncharacterized protein n=1 Tax=Trichinella murrelli TaxID=144512 RepID=A0A0V0TXX9_9BILA|nr:hypothetical protein T05_12939 [Trichinella murrelli]
MITASSLILPPLLNKGLSISVLNPNIEHKYMPLKKYKIFFPKWNKIDRMTQLGTFEQGKSMRNFTNSNFVNNRINDDRYPAFTLSRALCKRN